MALKKNWLLYVNDFVCFVHFRFSVYFISSEFWHTLRVFFYWIKRCLQVSIRDQRSTVQYSLKYAPCFRLLLDAVHMINMFDILLYDGYHSSNVFTFINGSLLNNYIPIFREYFNYCVRSSICFSILFCLKTTYNYFVSCAVLMTYSSLVLLSIIHLKNVLFYCLSPSSWWHGIYWISHIF